MSDSSEAIINSIGQASIVTSFYEDQLSQTPSVGAAYATQVKPLLKVSYTSQVASQNLTDYNNFPNNNTIARALGSKDPIQTLVSECIPCLGRTLSLGDLNPLDEIIQIIQNEIDKRWNYLMGIWTALNGSDIDLCSILNFMGGMCIPDLYALLALFNYYWLQLMGVMKTKVWNLLWSLIQPLLQSLCGGLENLLTKYIRLIIAPIECILSSLDYEYAKIYNATHLDFSKDKGVSVSKPYDHSFRSWAQSWTTQPLMSSYGWGLGKLKQMIINARDYVNSQIKRLRDAIKEILGVDSDSINDSGSMLNALRMAALVIGLIKAMIKFKEAGYSCSNGLSPDQTLSFITYSTDALGLPVTNVPTTTVTTSLPSNPDDWPAIPPVILPSNDFNTSSTENNDSVPAIYLPDCIAAKNQTESAKISTWIAELDSLTNN